MRNSLCLFILSVGLPSVLFSQYNCGQEGEEHPKFDVIFGGSQTLVFGPDTFRLKSGMEVIYRCEECLLKATDTSGKRNWSKDLSKFGCFLIDFTPTRLTLTKQMMGFDVLLEFKNRTYYMLNSKTGRTRKMTNAFVRRFNRKIKRHSYHGKR